MHQISIVNYIFLRYDLHQNAYLVHSFFALDAYVVHSLRGWVASKALTQCIVEARSRIYVTRLAKDII